jgi:hypothetical protein
MNAKLVLFNTAHSGDLILWKRDSDFGVFLSVRVGVMGCEGGIVDGIVIVA